jgi:hypothetical protein
MSAVTSIADFAAEDKAMPFRPFEDSDLNGLWLYDNEFPVTECRNPRELRGYRQAEHAAASDWRNEPGYSEKYEHPR